MPYNAFEIFYLCNSSLQFVTAIQQLLAERYLRGDAPTSRPRKKSQNAAQTTNIIHVRYIIRRINLFNGLFMFLRSVDCYAQHFYPEALINMLYIFIIVCCFIGGAVFFYGTIQGAYTLTMRPLPKTIETVGMAFISIVSVFLVVNNIFWTLLPNAIWQGTVTILTGVMWLVMGIVTNLAVHRVKKYIDECAEKDIISAEKISEMKKEFQRTVRMAFASLVSIITSVVIFTMYAARFFANPTHTHMFFAWDFMQVFTVDLSVTGALNIGIWYTWIPLTRTRTIDDNATTKSSKSSITHV